MLRDKYLQIMTTALSAYPTERIQNYFSTVQKEGLAEHGFPRLTANMGLLLAYNCLDKVATAEYLPLYQDMMTFCCENMINRHCANDFSVKEICFSWLAVKTANLFSDKTLTKWQNDLSQMNSWRDYDCIAPSPETPVGNWAAYGAASEWMRHVVTGVDCTDFLNRQIPSQLLSVDENGMYRDPNNPILYDLATRAQFAVLLFMGYDGIYRDALDDCLRRGGLLTLRMQSVTGEMAFGGRSNQYLFNEAYLASVCAFEAARYYKEGNLTLAGQFQDAAELAADAIVQWLERLNRKRHIKNHFPMDSSYGCEEYGYFDKYMISLASFLYLAILFTNDDIQPVPCPARLGGFTAVTSQHFHKFFASFGGYFLEWDTAADPHYDSTGLGRIHKFGVPSPLMLSIPFAAQPVYNIQTTDSPSNRNPSALAFCGGIPIIVDGKTCFTWSAEDNIKSIKQSNISSDQLEVTVINSFSQTELVRISENGVEIMLTGNGKIAYALPLFLHDGSGSFDDKNGIIIHQNNQQRNTVTVTLDGHSFHVESKNPISDTGLLYRNRNGIYKLHTVSGENTITLRLWCD